MITKKGISGENAVVKRSGPGRRLKSQQIIGNMVVAHDPESVGEIVFADVDRDVELIEDVGLPTKLARISELVGLRLGISQSDVESASDSEDPAKGSLASLRPWADGELPINVIIAAERHAHSNDRIVAALVSHLIQHVAIGEELRSLAASARRRAADELADVPNGMVVFIQELMAAGVVTKDVRDLSRTRMAAVVAALKGRDVAEVIDDVPVVIPRARSSSIPDGDIALPGVEDDRVLEGSSTPVEVPSAPNSEISGEVPDSNSAITGEAPDKVGLEGIGDAVMPAEIAASDPSPEPANDPVQPVGPIEPPVPLPVVQPPVPQGRWDVLDMTGLGYVIEEKMAESDDELRAIRYALPEVSTLSELAAPGSAEVNIALGVENQMDRDLAATFFTRWCRRTSVQMTEEQKRIWTLLLVEMPLRDRGRRIGEDGWFDGLLMPGPKGTARVRRIVAIDRSEEALRMALKRPTAS